MKPQVNKASPSLPRNLLPSFRCLGKTAGQSFNDDISIRCLKLSFRFLEEGDNLMIAKMFKLSLFALTCITCLGPPVLAHSGTVRPASRLPHADV